MEAICIDREKKIDYDMFDAAAIGPGLGKGTEASRLVTEVLKEFKGKLASKKEKLNLFDFLLTL